jgi:peptidoglycan biosynthesis protein MviN/MurJ (putative lipid II flippase)
MSSVINLALLIYALRKKLKQLEMADLLNQLGKMIGAVIGAGCITVLLARFWKNNFGHENVLTRLGEVFVPMMVATAFYFAAAAWWKIPAAMDVISLLRQKLGLSKN